MTPRELLTARRAGGRAAGRARARLAARQRTWSTCAGSPASPARTGWRSSAATCALFVTDFRYVEQAAGAGARHVRARARQGRPGRGRRRADDAGGSGSTTRTLTVRQLRAAQGARPRRASSWSPPAGSSRSCGASRTRPRSRRSGPPPRWPTRCSPRSPSAGWSAGRSTSVASTRRSGSAAAARRARRSRSIIAGGRARRAAARRAARRRRSSADTLVVVDMGCVLDGYCSDCTRTFATGDGLSDEMREVYDLVLRAQLASLDAVRAGASRQGGRLSRARPDRRGRARRPVRPRPRPRRRPGDPRGPAAVADAPETRRSTPGKSSRSSRACTCPAGSECASRTSSSSPTTGPRSSRASPRS